MRPFIPGLLIEKQFIYRDYTYTIHPEGQLGIANRSGVRVTSKEESATMKGVFNRLRGVWNERREEVRLKFAIDGKYNIMKGSLKGSSVR